jgi:cell division protein FtsN
MERPQQSINTPDTCLSMAHDYANKARSKIKSAPKSQSKRSANQVNRHKVPGWAWLLVGIAMGAFVMFLIRLAELETDQKRPSIASMEKPVEAPKVNPENRKPTVKSQPTLNLKETAKNTTKTQPKISEDVTSSAINMAAREPQKPRYDFYHLLKENEVLVDVDGAAAGSSAASGPERVFIMQVASFREPGDAEQLRVELLLLNLDAHTEKVKIRNGETWYRVLAGPFKSRSLLAKTRSTLISNGYQALVMEYKDPA